MSFQGRWLGLVAGAWLGAVQPVPQTGFQSLLAYWAGGASAGAASQAGYRSLLAYWAGGASTEPASQAGYRSLLAYWAGGAVASQVTTATAHGKLRRKQPRKRGRYEVDSFADWVLEPPRPDDDEFLIISMMTR